MQPARSQHPRPETFRSVQLILPLKLTPPPLADGALLRPDLQAILSEVRLYPLTLLVAPAGFGKTTLLVQWARELARTGAPVVWLGLAPGERDPAIFLAYLISAFRRVYPGVGADAWRILHSAANLDRDWPLVAGTLCADLQRQITAATFLILDDLHAVLDSAVIGQIIGYLLRAAPPGLRVIIASRREPSFAPIPRLRAEGRLVELSQHDLHLTVDDIRRVLAQQGTTLNEPELMLLLERTGGWALSVQFAARALAAQPADRRGAFVRALGGSQEQLLAYLATEVLADLPAELVEFLCLASVPAQFDATLLDEVLECEDAAYLIGRARALGLPLQAVDARGDQVHLHPLWRELLLRTATERLGPDTLTALRRRFGRALEARGALEAALEHYASAGATDDLVRALRERAWPLLNSPRRETVRRWLARLDPAQRDGDPDLLHMWGVSQALADPISAAPVIERAAELYEHQRRWDRRLAALGELAVILVLQGRIAKLEGVCIQAIRAANHTRDQWSRGAALVCVVLLLSARGRGPAVLRVARHAAAYPLGTMWRWLLAMTVGSMACQLGLPAEACRAVDEALQTPAIDCDDRLRQALLGLKSLALAEQGQLAEGLALAAESHRHLRDYGYGGIAAYSAARLALLLTLNDRPDEAMTYIAQARGTLQELGALGPLATLQVIELYALLRRGQAANARAAVASVRRRLREPGAAADLRYWLLLALILGESGEPARALELAQEAAALMEHQGYRLFLAAARLYCAHLIGASDPPARAAALRAGWQIVIDDRVTFLPLLPQAAVADIAVAGLRAGVPPAAVGPLLRHHLPEQAADLLAGLLGEPDAALRAAAAALLGDLGSGGTFAALRPLLKDRDSGVRAAAERALKRLVYRPPYTLRIRTLGAFGIWRGEQEIREREWRSSKARQLLQLLVTERGRWVTREQAMEALWPHMEPEIATNNLRVTMNRLVKAIEPDRPDGAPSSFLLQQGETFALNLEGLVELDVLAFDQAVAEGQQAAMDGRRQAAIAALRRALDLYSGPYLPDALYEDWTALERERLGFVFNEAALQLGTLLLDIGQAHAAIGVGWRALESDPGNEGAYRMLMRAHAYLGERSTALRLYARCADVLRAELGVEPMPETTALYESIRTMR